MQQERPATLVSRGKPAPDAPATGESALSGRIAGEPVTADICVIGAGSGGLAVAAAAAAFGRKVVLIEKHRMGGDCLSVGGVPSKALLAAARRAQAMRAAGAFGIVGVEPTIDPRSVQDHVSSVIAAIAPNDSVERFTGLGVRVIMGAARFLDKKTVAAGDFRVRARRFVVATGSSPLLPPIAGLDSVPYFTNESIFENDKKLEHLIVIGAGPIGLELAQAYRRLGSRVTVLEADRALADDDPEMTAPLLASLRAEGIDILERTSAERVEVLPGRIRVTIASGDRLDAIDGSHILVAAGRRPNVADLNLEGAGVKVDQRGIKVDRGLRTSNRRVFAIGDVTGAPPATHLANYHAAIVVRRSLFRLPAKVDLRRVPRVTFTEPELAQVGLSEQQAAKERISINVLRAPYHENDRAEAEHTPDGHIKVLTDKKGRVIGASIVGAAAGELIQMWALAISAGLPIKALTEWVPAYPTLSEINKRAAERFYATAPGNPWLRRAASFLAWLG